MNQKFKTYLSIFIFISVVLVLAGVIWAFSYTALFQKNLETNDTVVLDKDRLQEQRGDDYQEYEVQVVAEDLQVPWTIAFIDETSFLVTERSGTILLLSTENQERLEVGKIEQVSSDNEEGLMGLALDPEFSNNQFLYISYVYPEGNNLWLKVSRLTLENNQLSDEQPLLDRIPAAQYHAGSQLMFGPDDKLYITTGDAVNKDDAQDLNSLAGKILRINKDGSIPDDNPFENSAIYSYGHRNPQGLTFDPEGNLYSSEHGPSVFDGPAGGDEINLIKAGKNYGWPLVSHDKSKSGLEDPLLVFTPAEAPGSAHFYTSELFPQFTNTLLFGALKGEGIIQVTFDEEDPSKVLSYEKIAIGEVGRVRYVTQGPDGIIYFTSSNTDGRGQARSGDDRIYRLVPVV